MRIVAAMMMVLGMLLAARVARAEPGPETLDRCGFEYVDCATGPNSRCLIGPAQLDDACLRECERARGECLRQADPAYAPSPRPGDRRR